MIRKILFPLLVGRTPFSADWSAAGPPAGFLPRPKLASFRNLPAAAALALLLAGSSWAQGNAENGKRLFTKLGCYTCHGYQGQGGAAGAKLAPNPIAAPRLIAYVRHPAGSMPPFTSKVVSDADLTDVHAFLTTVPAPPPAKNIPLLNQ